MKVPNLLTLGQQTNNTFNLKVKVKMNGTTVQLEVDPNISGYTLRQLVAQ